LRRRQEGQSVVEFILAVPVLAVLLFSTFAAGMLAVDRVAAGQAVRAGARLASELGGTDTQGVTEANHDSFDRQVISQIMAVSLAMSYHTLQEIDIYPACTTVCDDPVYPRHQVGTSLDRRNPFTGNVIGTQNSFVLAERRQIPPNDTPIVVLLQWIYQPPVTVGFFSITVKDYAVMRAAPVFG
jgi:Flp pilus assembly protein TadG